MTGMKIYLSNGTYTEMPEVDPEVITAITSWFQSAEPTDVIRLTFADVRKAAYLQKQHIVQIEAAL